MNVCFSPPIEIGSRNERRLCAIFYNRTPGSEIVHGLLDRIMSLVKIPFDETKTNDHGYYLNSKCQGRLPTAFSGFASKMLISDSAFFPDRHAQIIVRGKNLGVMGVLHPNVIEQFGLKLPCSMLELNIEPFV